MTEGTLKGVGAKREYGQLLNLHSRILIQLKEIRDGLVAPTTTEILSIIRVRTGAEPDEGLAEIMTAVEEALRALKLSEARIRDEIIENHEHTHIEGINNLPATLARFLAERRELPGFNFDVRWDENRGWVILWKEYTEGDYIPNLICPEASRPSRPSSPPARGDACVAPWLPA